MKRKRGGKRKGSAVNAQVFKIACSRLSDNRVCANIKKGIAKIRHAHAGSGPPSVFHARFLNSRFPHYLGPW